MNKATENYISDLHYYLWIQPMAADAYDLGEPSIGNIVDMIETTEEYNQNLSPDIDTEEVAKAVHVEMVKRYIIKQSRVA